MKVKKSGAEISVGEGRRAFPLNNRGSAQRHSPTPGLFFEQAAKIFSVKNLKSIILSGKFPAEKIYSLFFEYQGVQALSITESLL